MAPHLKQLTPRRENGASAATVFGAFKSSASFYPISAHFRRIDPHPARRAPTENETNGPTHKGRGLQIEPAHCGQTEETED